MNITETAWQIFNSAINHYHLKDNVDSAPENPYPAGSLEHLLYAKNWIDTVQWHLEDIIREPSINPAEALAIKRRIDASNQQRTDLVEFIDEWFRKKYQETVIQKDARLNTETPAWALDRFSILALKIYHMAQEVTRTSATEEHRQACQQKLYILEQQRVDLGTAITQLLSDIEQGKVRMKTYKQMKMYNDESLNPVLYQSIKDDQTSS